MAQHTDANAPTYLSLYEVLLFITTLKDPKAHVDLLWKQCQYIVNGDIAFLTAKSFPATSFSLVRELDYSAPAESEPVMRITFSTPGSEVHFILPSVCFESKDPRKDYTKWELKRQIAQTDEECRNLRNKLIEVKNKQEKLCDQLEDLNSGAV